MSKLPFDIHNNKDGGKDGQFVTPMLIGPQVLVCFTWRVQAKFTVIIQ